MRVIIPYSTMPDNFSDNVAYTLRMMGHEVMTMPPVSVPWTNTSFGAAVRAWRAKSKRDYFPGEERWLLKAVASFRPSLVLTLTQALSEETLFRLKKMGVPHLVAWWGDSPANMQRMGLFVEGWDTIFLKDPDAVKKFRRVGYNAHLLHEACNPAWHKPLCGQENDRVVVAGNYYAFRQALVLKLLRQGVPMGLYGARLPMWAHAEIRMLHTGRYLVKEEKSRVFGAAMACLNSTHVSEGNSMNCRAFEIAGAGGLQIMEYRPIISTCFEPGEELLVFDTFDDLLEHIERARRAPGEMVAIREAGAKRARAEHTYKHRLDALLQTIKASAS